MKVPAQGKAFRRIIWGAVVVLPLVLVWPCWHVISQVTETKSVVIGHYVMSSRAAEAAVAQLGTPERAAGRLGAFVRLPKWLTRDKSRSDLDLRPIAIRLLGACGEPGIDALISLLSEEDDVLCTCAAQALGRAGRDARKAVPHLVRLLSGPGSREKPWARSKAAGALGRMGPDAAVAVPELAQALSDPHDELRANAAGALLSFGSASRAAIPQLAAALQDKDGVVRELAVRALGLLGPAAREATASLA